ncbi:MAG: hypothetical protein WC269_00710 [Candidatus Gracilibacteria bacterium]|jgi:hypothetical protein
MKSVQTILNIKKVSLVFFIATGLIHLGSGALIANNLYLKQALIINRIMDVPFVLTGLIYAFASLKLGLTDPEKSHKALDIGIIIVLILIVIGLIVVNFTFPDITTING